ncbi:AraC family transcriptional regulator [Solimonas sp. K1W22B-7]|uniref:helix-turn-helix domain-containing protein n=1 Tax=Solimonas sp. K1W22B-7 TaxID=2303331 RepID=UPI000E32EB17|nr:helix-turn-helix transcriptional regulator [Solimonas sp. K1W22B-7]AXQ30513.1 AraC family transcriptional regulator [Solimonas sp. K1W22B-7]
MTIRHISSATVCLTQYRWGKIPLDKAVAQLAQRADGSFARLEEVASALCVSPRTLKRRLRECGWTYRGLIEDIRRVRGQELLTSGAGSIESVAAAVGYSMASGFHRAFRRWHSVTPGAYRRQEMQAASGCS